MEPRKMSVNRRTLLPAEAQLCNTVGLTKEEYWHFVALADAYTSEQKHGYELIPNVRNEPVTIVTLVIGIALQAVSMLLAPKPQAQKGRGGPNITSPDKKGQSKFAPQTSFDSVQELATLGDVIPLIFTRKGVRVSCGLVWSQMLSNGIGQQLRIIGMFGSGKIKGRPEWAGYAIGDVLLENYSEARVALYFQPDGGRMVENSSDRYPQGSARRTEYDDPFSVLWRSSNKKTFCGTRTPGSNTEFGVYAPMANGTRLRLKYETTLNPMGTTGPARELNLKKREKITSVYPRGTAVTRVDSIGVTVTVSGENYNTNKYPPIGVDDVDSAVEQGRFAADDGFAVGQEYLIGNRPAVCIGLEYPEPWSMGRNKSYYFYWTEGQGWVDWGWSLLYSTAPTHERLLVQRLAIATVSNNRDCDATEIGIKSTVFKQINGASNVNSMPENSRLSDIERSGGNFQLGSIQAYVKRISFFKLQIRRLGENAKWQDISGGTVFAIRGRTPQFQYNYIRIYHPLRQWEFRLMPYPGTGVLKTKRNLLVYLLEPGVTRRYNQGNFTIEFAGRNLRMTDLEMCNTEWILGGMDYGDPRPHNLNAYDVVNDGFTYQEETASHADGPEHSVCYVNEIVIQPEIPTYKGLCTVGLRIDSTREWTSFNSLSAYFKDGTIVERLTNSNRDSTNLLPEIAYALLTDPHIGAGKLIGADQVNRSRMTQAAKFCQKNNFTWDGVIDSKLNLREWIFEQAGYCLLDFTILGGQFSLVPSVPVKDDWSIDNKAKPEIKALFTDGNIKDLKVSFLSPEERQLFTGVATWRKNRANGFPETRTVAMRLSDQQGGSDDDPTETFDMSNFCTSEEHVITFLKYALRIRQLVDHGLTFQTTPQSAMGLEPGEYFRLVSEVTHTSRFNNGTIAPDGTIQCVDVMADGNYEILYWEPGTEGVKSTKLKVKNGKAQDTELRGTLFTIKNSTTTDRVYKVESLSYGDEGFVEVAASHVPLTPSGSLAVLDWGNNNFVIDTV